MEEDPLLKDKKGVGTELNKANFLNDGLYSAGVTSEQLETIGTFFNDLYERVRNKKKSPRQVTRNAITMLNGAIFAIGTKDYGNIEWKEHCASSLREIIHEWEGLGFSFAGDFREFYPNSPKTDTTETYKNFKTCYGYFSGIGHHNASGIMSSLISLRNDSTLKLEDCYKDDIFLETVKKFFVLIIEIIEFTKITNTTTD